MNPMVQAVEEKFKGILRAYEVLTDTQQRRAFMQTRQSRLSAGKRAY